MTSIDYLDLSDETAPGSRRFVAALWSLYGEASPAPRRVWLPPAEPTPRKAARLAEARRLLDGGADLRKAARAVGYQDWRSLRRALRGR